MWVRVLGLVALSASSSVPPPLEGAVPVELPIDEVMVFSDRARVIRRGPVNGSGLRTLRLPDLPGALVPGSVRVSVAQGG